MKLTFIALSLLLLISCNKDGGGNCFQSAGEDDALIIQLPNFNKLDLQDAFIINLIQDSLSFLEIKGKTNIISHISAQVNQSTLALKDENKCTLFKGYHKTTINLHFKNIERIDIINSPELYSEDTLYLNNLTVESKADLSTWNLKLNCNELNLKFHAVVGKMYLAGLVNKAYIYSSGTNHCFFKNLICQEATINHSCLGNIHLTVIQNLNLSIFRSGDFYCYSQPISKQIDIDKNSTGQAYFFEE